MRIICGKWKGVDTLAPAGWPGSFQRPCPPTRWREQENGHPATQRDGIDRVGEAKGPQHQADCGRLRDNRIWTLFADRARAAQRLGRSQRAIRFPTGRTFRQGRVAASRLQTGVIVRSGPCQSIKSSAPFACPFGCANRNQDVLRSKTESFQHPEIAIGCFCMCSLLLASS